VRYHFVTGARHPNLLKWACCPAGTKEPTSPDGVRRIASFDTMLLWSSHTSNARPASVRTFAVRKRGSQLSPSGPAGFGHGPGEVDQQKDRLFRGGGFAVDGEGFRDRRRLGGRLYVLAHRPTTICRCPLGRRRCFVKKVTSRYFSCTDQLSTFEASLPSRCRNSSTNSLTKEEARLPLHQQAPADRFPAPPAADVL
jgi:hypothetical protein